MALVFAASADEADSAVAYLRQGAPGIPVWLFATAMPSRETAEACERVLTRPGAFGLVVDAARQSWPRRVALSVGPWTGTRRDWSLKVAPFLIPPFRALLLNENGDFLAGRPGPVGSHAARRTRDAAAAAWNGIRELRHGWRDRARDAGRVLKLTALNVAAYPGAWMARRWFERLHGNEALGIDAPLPESDRIDWLTVRHTAVEWNGAALYRAADDGGTRCVLWGEGRITPEMLALFDDPRTFAVAPQQHFRAWKPVVFPTAPFRALQKGEAAQVLGPLSDTILVDRVKLLELGVPGARLSGTAWMLLYWQAAAAGWRSYSVGTGDALSEEPDAPVVEATFFRRALGDRDLLRLGPRHPALARGAVAFRPGGSLERRERPRVLVVSPFLPFPLSHGGAVRIWNLCRALADRVDFVLIALREHGERVEYERLHEVFRDVRVVDIDERPSPNERLPKQVRHHRSAAMRAAIEEIAREWSPHILQVEYTHMADFRDAAAWVPAILVEHDVTFTLYRQLADSQPAAEAEAEFARWLAFERQWLKTYDGVWTVSEQDRAVAAKESGRPSQRIDVVANGVDVERYRPAPGSGVPEILYVGSFRHLPNVIGFERMARRIMPLVWQAIPEARLSVVAGPRHEEFWQKRALDSRVEVHGFVEDLRPLYARAAVVAVPLEVSAGTNIKVLEAMACGRAVVSTTVGCQGLGIRDGVDGLIRDDDERFAAAIRELLADPALRERVAEEARATAERAFSWRAIAERALASYSAVNVAVATFSGSV